MDRDTATHVTHARLNEIAEHTESIDDRTRKFLALSEEQLDVQRRQLEALDTQNLIAWLQYNHAKNTIDPIGQDNRELEAMIAKRLRL